MDQRDPRRLGQEDREGLLPIGREAGVDVGLDHGRLEGTSAIEADGARAEQIEAAADAAERGQEVAEDLRPDAAHHHLAAGGRRQAGPRGGFDPVAEHRHRGALQALDALDLDLAVGPVVDDRAHRPQHGDQLEDLGLDGGVRDRGAAFRQDAEVETGLGRPDARIGQPDLGAPQAAAARRDEALGGGSDLAAEARDRVEVEIDLALADRATAEDRHRDPVRALQEGAEQQDRHPVAARVGERHVAALDGARVEHQGVATLGRDPHADRLEHLARHARVADRRDVVQRRRSLAEKRRDHRLGDEVLGSQAGDLAGHRLAAVDAITGSARRRRHRVASLPFPHPVLVVCVIEQNDRRN